MNATRHNQKVWSRHIRLFIPIVQPNTRQVSNARLSHLTSIS
jgi:hypothetical protein